jgi:hypothetical protein
MPPDLALNRSLLTAALVAAQLPAGVPEANMLRAWLDSWSGAGHVVVAMHDLGYNARLTQSPFVWWAEFCQDEVNPLPRWLGRGSDATPWRAVQQAALDALTRTEET